MAEELEGVWHFLSLTEDEKENVLADHEHNDRGCNQKWLIGKLLTRRPFNKDAMLSMFKVVWRISKEAEVFCIGFKSISL